MVTLRDFDQLALHAAGDVFAFARFVARTEGLFDGAWHADALARYAAAWFDAEILNALALERWQSEGSPATWDARWREAFERDAMEAVAALRAAALALAAP